MIFVNQRMSVTDNIYVCAIKHDKAHLHHLEGAV